MIARNNSKTWHSIERVVLLGNHLPRRCGIATFTSDLADAIVNVAPQIDTSVVAMDDRPESYPYAERVRRSIEWNHPSEYVAAAQHLNAIGTDLVCVQHEYGIFGGPDGEMLLDFLRQLTVPVVTSLHTVLNEPTQGQRRVLQFLAEISERLVVLSRGGSEILQRVYGVPERKIAYIPHGIHEVPFDDQRRDADRLRLGVTGKRMLFTFGLLSPNKGIDAVIDALPQVLAEHPDTVYVALGATHPEVKKHQGEEYRNDLIRRAKKLGVGDHLILVDRFVELPELMGYLRAADVYVTPYRGEAQIVSGALAYALGAGLPVVSTPYAHAREMLADGRGRLVPFADPGALAGAVNELLRDDHEREQVRKRAYDYTRPMCWSRVAESYLDLFSEVRRERSRPQPRSHRSPLPPVVLDHLGLITDSVGIYEHARYSVPDRDHGYCSDDNARALIVAVRAGRLGMCTSGVDLRALESRYLAFLNHAFNPGRGRFRNVLGFERLWQDETGSEDSFGRSVWALGVAATESRYPGHVRLAEALFREALRGPVELEHPRAIAYTLLGLQAWLGARSGERDLRTLHSRLARELFERWGKQTDESWPWCTDTLTYANARPFQALLAAGFAEDDQEMVARACHGLKWLLDVQTSWRGNFEPVGCHGWFPKGGIKARYDQQPIEAAGAVDACLAAERVTGNPAWFENARWCFGWFLGENDLARPLYEPATGACYDGLTPEGVNENTGAESTLSWLMALLAMHDRSRRTVPLEGRELERSRHPLRSSSTASPVSRRAMLAWFESTPN